MENKDNFYYITFVNNNKIYLDLLEVLIESIQIFSKYSLIVYFVSVPNEIVSTFSKKYGDKIICRQIDDLHLLSIYYYKPYIILDAIKNGLKNGFYIDTDNVITKYCDDVVSILDKIKDIPISPIHPDDVDIPQYYMMNLGLNTRRTQHYVHASCLLFKKSNIDFLKEWYNNCLKSRFAFWDETCLNCTYWKYNCVDHYLPIIDPYFEQFYTKSGDSNQIYVYHGCKDVNKQRKLLVDLVKYYKTN
jgi:hypothetical protein